MALSQLQKKIGIKFKKQEYLQQVFIHRSYINENKNSGFGDNERMEFLGDAVLELVVTEYLYKNFPNPEGDLTSYRSALVKGETLSKVSQELDLGGYLMLSRGEKRHGGSARNLILANTFEALVGAIYLDSGYQKAKIFITKYLIPRFDEILNNESFRDARSSFQEWSQEKLNATPEYRVLKESGPDHSKIFEIGCYIKDELFGTGKGTSKQTASQEAAKIAMQKIQKED
ncbi:MAG: ribonuclease III [Patescibacteria group bacterium]